MVPRQGSVEVRAAYHAARNEILRPGATVFCSRYFCEKWMPRLGGTATALVLTLRAIAAENPSADDSPQAIVEVSQQTLGQRVGCSANTIYRELKSNAELAHFVRTEERYVRNPKGRVRQSESVYYIAMDDPLIPEDEPLLEQIVERYTAEAAAPRPERVIVPERVPTPAPSAQAASLVHQNGGQGSLLGSDVVHQNDGQQRADRSAKLMDNSWSPKMMDYKVTESNLQKPVTVTPSGTGTGGVLHACSDGLAAWRQTTEDLARHSARELDDKASTGYHIAVWNHARKHDKQRRGKPLLTDGVFEILRDLSLRRAEASKPQPQGKAWTRRTQKWFEENGVPLPVRSSVRIGQDRGDHEEQEEQEDVESIRAALAGAPFMRNRMTGQKDGS
jgi:hypothetical protein